MNRNTTQSEVRQMIREVNQDGSGRITKDEFEKMMSKIEEHDPKSEEDELLALFKFAKCIIIILGFALPTL